MKVDPQRRAKIYIRPDEIHGLLGLPEGMKVIFTTAEYDPPRIVVLVSGDDLPEVPIDAEAPVLEGSVFKESLFWDGKYYARWGWEPS